MKYFEDDDEYIIRNRIKRCITKAKRRQWKKADAALGATALVDLNINKGWCQNDMIRGGSTTFLRTHHFWWKFFKKLFTTNFHCLHLTKSKTEDSVTIT